MNVQGSSLGLRFSFPLKQGGPFAAFCKDKLAISGAFFLMVIIACAVLAPLIAPYDPDKTNLRQLFQPIGSFGHWLGTDELGRDQLSRLMFGARVSLVAASLAVSIAVGVGLPLGLIAGYRGGWFDFIASRSNDAFMSVPALVLALTIIAVLGRGLVPSMFAIGIVFAPRFFRLARAIAVGLRTETFIEVARAIGCSHTRILVRHITPNLVSPMLVQVALTLGNALIAEASLSFLGAGVMPPTASWGSMIGNAYNQISRAPTLAYIPGLCIMVTVLSLMVVGDGLRRALDAGRMRNHHVD